ncbi:pseudaminic acid synthase [Aureibacter tunicatorum]|uniref:Pseudaminic acid synthase n=1 Tax=Aureibacter tunicatorum TaxID=866807 RepID=A0AAE3XQG0_9BACT|nr:pseudaminic acid synthase [Aureibacter tunicatorum]MDR6240697.1 pseudaminic acid synthase [Aureibacter tunicatorum]BDD06970.1 N-acetylneuraminic acid synthase [Aureibacter tunicatorum]
MKLGSKQLDSSFIIAELSANHNNDFELAKETIYAMKESGADCVKLQTYTADSLSLNADTKYFEPRKEGLWKGYRPYDLYQEASMPWEWQPKLIELAESLEMVCFSSPFDFKAVDFLEELNTPAYKIASFEIQDIPLIRYVASKGKPVIMSTGIATQEDIELAVKTCREQGNDQIALLKCTSAYPTPFNEINLNVIPDMKDRFGVEVIGLSDHTMGSTVPLGAVAIGARIIEKHFVLDRSNGGVDASFSMEPQEFKHMVDSVRDLEKALGTVTYDLTEKALDSRTRGRSLFIVEDLKAGEVLTEKNIKSVRPGAGLHPKYYDEVLGKSIKKDVAKGTPLNDNLIYENT